MDVKLKEGLAGYKDVIMRKDNKIFSMFFMGVGDLFWSISKETPDSLKETFDISKSESDVYELFDELYENASKGKVLEEDDGFFKSQITHRNFFNSEAKTIEWHSDETYFESDDVVKIIKQKDNYHLEFTRPKKYEDPYHYGSPRMISIRFRNSGSYYHPFNIIFMKMFQKAQNLREREANKQIEIEQI